MSTQTGIFCDEKLLEHLAICRNPEAADRYRMLKIIIKDEQMALDEARETSATWDRDWDPMVLNAVDLREPCFILFRLDEKSERGGRWVLISWSPDASPVRSKMLYASTKATLRKELGSVNVADDLYGNVRDDVSLAGYEKHKATAAAPAPLTRDEEEKQEALLSKPEVSVNSKHQTMAGLSFPLSSEASASIDSFKDGALSYVQLRIDIAEEIIGVEETGCKVSIDELPELVPKDVPRYHLLAFPHTFDGEPVNSNVFIYSMPGYSCSIKERMLYSSCLNSVVEYVVGRGIPVAKKLEVESGADLKESYLFEEIHPRKVQESKTFSKPAAPGRARRGRHARPTVGSTS